MPSLSIIVLAVALCLLGCLFTWIIWLQLQERRVHRKNESDMRARAESHRLMVQTAPEALMVLDVDANRYIEANESALRLFGIGPGELRGIDPFRLSPPLQEDGAVSAEVFRANISRAVNSGSARFEWKILCAPGTQLSTEVHLAHLPSSKQRLLRASFTDITARLDAQRDLRHKADQLEATLENTDQGVVMTNANLVIVNYNQRFLDLLELSSDQIAPGDTSQKFLRICAERGDYGPGDVDSIVEERLGLVLGHKTLISMRKRADGVILEVRRRPIPSGGVVTTYTDVSEAHRLTEQLSFQATHDYLTSLMNRREFERQLDRIINVSRAAGSTHAICYMDLDQFKVINDTCGHAAGDELLRQLSAELRNRVRKSDFLARLGGDEFGVLLEDCSLTEAQRVADTLRECVSDFRFVWLTRSFRVGVSVGLVQVSQKSGSVAEVLSGADAACYAAKEHGRNRVHLYSADDDELTRRHDEMLWVARAQEALDNDRLRLVCQPIVPLDPAAEEGEHYELLLRMEDDEGALITPGLFLPAAERFNLIGHIDRWVVRRAFETLAESPSALRTLQACSINLSGDSVSDSTFLEFIKTQLSLTGVPPEKIVFEITETAAISTLTRATAFITALRNIGCRFSLDDFGSGLSSFGYLKTLPVDYLKIDGMFVKGILDDPIDHAMVKSINDIGHVMGKRTIAEFVESPEILEHLRELGVDYAQGYAIGRPQPFPMLSMESKTSSTVRVDDTDARILRFPPSRERA